jgi:hypothetical protein
VCLLPSLILVGLLSLETNFLVHTLKNWSYILNVFNSTANSLIFFWRNKALRTEGMNRIKIIGHSLRRLSRTSTMRAEAADVQRAENNYRGRLYKTLNHFFNHYFVVK